MNQDFIKQYYDLQHHSFCEHVKSLVEALDKILELKGSQVTQQQRAAVKALKTIYAGHLIEDIKRDLATGNVTQETIEKRVQLDIEVGKAVVNFLNPNPIVKIFLELLFSEQANANKAGLMTLLLWLNSSNSKDRQ